MYCIDKFLTMLYYKTGIVKIVTNKKYKNEEGYSNGKDPF